jgi:Glycosyl transferase family group 2/PilZ domain
MQMASALDTGWRWRILSKCRSQLKRACAAADDAGVVGNEQTPLGRFFDRHPSLLRGFALTALVWGIAYLTWRVGWSSEGANPVVFAMLLITEVYGGWALVTLAWFSWSRPAIERPPATPGRGVDVYVCTYDEPVEVVAATLAGCRALTYPHTTYLLDDGRRPEMEQLARVAGARYLTRPDNLHAKAGNINAALPRTDGELVLMLDADHVPMPDALDAMVGYFDEERVALVQSPHDFFNHDSIQHYVVGRHEQSLFYRVVCPGKDRHGAAYWCGSAALLRREALIEIGGVATETIAEDFHTTIRLLRHGWRSRYHDEVLVQGLAPHDLDGYLLQRDRWARGNLAVFTLPESPFRARELRPLQRLSFFASLAAYLAPPMRLLLLLTLGVVLWTGELPMKVSTVALAALWLPAVALNLTAGSALARGYMRIGETAHYELLTMEIYTRALRCAVRPGRTAFRVTPKQGADLGGFDAVRKLHLVLACGAIVAGGTLMRLLDLAGVGPLPDLPGIAIVLVPLLGLIELRRVVRTLFAVGRHRQRRLIYRLQGEAPARCLTVDGQIGGQLVDASASGVGLVMDAPLAVGSRPTALLELHDSTGEAHEVAAQLEVRSCREADGRWLVGSVITGMDAAARMLLMEWCYVVCSHEQLRGRRPVLPVGELEPIVVPLPIAPVHAMA